MAEQGWFAISLPEEYGGVGGYMDMIAMLEIIGYHSTSLARFWNINVNMVGGLHKGWSQLLTVLSKERIALSTMCAGAAQAVLDQALEYAKERKQFGRSIASFQVISHKLVEMQTLIDAARLLAFRAGRLLEDGKPCNLESAQAKFFAADSYLQVATEGLQIMGANGYSMEYAMQRHFREAKLFQIFGGTNEILRNVVARELLN